MSAPDTADSSPEVYRGHVPNVEVSRCGDWLSDPRDADCPGDENGCTRCRNEPRPPFDCLGHYDLYCISEEPLTQKEIEEWLEMPHPTTISHGQFIRDYGRCPEQCEPAKQLSLLEET